MQYFKRQFATRFSSKHEFGAVGVSDIWRSQPTSYAIVITDIYRAYWDTVIGDKFIDSFGGDALTLSKSLDTNYIPGTESVNILAPENEIYVSDDTDNVFYNESGTPVAISRANLVSTDYSRVLVKYANTSPYHIYSIALLKNEIQLTTQQIKDIHEEFDLWWFWSGSFNDGGRLKDNRTF